MSVILGSMSWDVHEFTRLYFLMEIKPTVGCYCALVISACHLSVSKEIKKQANYAGLIKLDFVYSCSKLAFSLFLSIFLFLCMKVTVPFLSAPLPLLSSPPLPVSSSFFSLSFYSQSLSPLLS